MASVVSITSGDHSARFFARRDALVEAHLDLVHQIAHSVVRLLPPCFELDDLVSAGHLGLLRAATNYRPEAHGDTPFTAYARPVIRGAMIDSIRRSQWRDSMGEALDAIPERSVVVNIEDSIDASRRRSRVAAAVANLDKRHRKVVEWYYTEDVGLSEVGDRLGVVKSRASQLHMEAVRELREALS